VELRSQETALTKGDSTFAAEIQEMIREQEDKIERREELEERRHRNPQVRQEYNQLDQEISQLTTRIREAQLAQKAIRESGLKPTKVVTLRQVQIVAAAFLKIPLSVLSVNVDEALNSIGLIKNRVFGQDHIIDAAAERIAANREERVLEEAKARKLGKEYFSKPIWSAMFAGSTGTGKTEISKQIAIQLGIPESDLLRFDMNEFQEAHSISRLIGSPPGYVGYDAGGALTNAVMEREYRVILFDEIEKAAPEIFTALMTMLDEGHMTDSQGRKVRFGNTIVLFTTNLGQEYTTLNRTQLFLLAKERMRELDVTLEELQKMNERDLRLTLFKGDARKKWGEPQVARIDNMLMTNNHTPERIKEIVRSRFKEMAADWAEFKNKRIFITEAALNHIADSYKVTEGARGVQRAYRKLLSDPLNILSRNVNKGDVITVDLVDGRMDFVVTTGDDFERAKMIPNQETSERRRFIREQILKNPGGVGRANQELKLMASGVKPEQMFNNEFIIRDVMVHVLRRFRK
jgi:ATP-dependent Clp protease ATP-binding subunit ClpA